MKLSTAVAPLREAGPEELVHLVSDVEIDPDFRATGSLPRGWRGLIANGSGVRPLNAESVIRRRDRVYLFRPAPAGDAFDGWPLRFTVRAESGPTGEPVALRCRAVVRLADPRAVVTAYPQEEGVWSARDLEHLVGNLLAPELTGDALAGRLANWMPAPGPGRPEASVPDTAAGRDAMRDGGQDGGQDGGPPVALPGRYIASLLGRLDAPLLGAGIEVVDLAIAIERPAAAGEVAGALEQEPAAPVSFSRTGPRAVSGGGAGTDAGVGPGAVRGTSRDVAPDAARDVAGRDAAVRLAVLESTARGTRFAVPKTSVRRRAGGSGTLDRIRRIRELLAGELQASARIVRQWSQTGDVAMTRDALELFRLLDATEINLRTVIPEMVPVRRATRGERRLWFETYERDFALAHRVHAVLEEVQEAFLGGRIDAAAVRGHMPALKAWVDRLSRSVARRGQ